MNLTPETTGTMHDKTTAGKWWLMVLPLLALSGCVPPNYVPIQNQPGQTPVTSATPATVQTQPAQPAAQPNAGTLKALEQLTELKEELKKLRNVVEEIEFNTETAKRRRQNLFQDLDRRLLALERAQRLLSLGQQGINGGVGAVPGLTPGLDPAPGIVNGTAIIPATSGDANVAIVESVPGTATLTPPASTTPGDNFDQVGVVSVPEQEAYEQAFNLLKQSKYQDAIAGFQNLADTWPESQLADDSYYWMSEARYVNREFEAALMGFRAVATRYPDSPRVPEALLKTGYIQYDIGAYEEAAEIFRDLLERFPGHQVAVSAQTRLRRIEQTIQQ